jgi:phosphatidylserine/phosphatidylglycerophosphate/cardiolipin synthase-like enzyme
MSDIPTLLAALSADQLAALAMAMQNRWVSLASSPSTLANHVGGNASVVAQAFGQLEQAGFTNAQAGILLGVASVGRDSVSTASTLADLVLSGPDVPGIPTSATDAVVHSLFIEAKVEVLIAGYAFHNARTILEPLAKRLEGSPDLKVILHVDISRGLTDTSTSENIVLRFAQDFWRRHWPWQPRPEVWYDPRALASDRAERACLHAKFIAIDGHTVLITSANFTEAAQHRNIEAGIVLRSMPRTRQLTDYFAALRQNGSLQRL